MMLLVNFFFVGLFLHFANSNFEYDYDQNSNYNSNGTIEDCNGPESDQLSKNTCFCYDEPETNIPYSICKESVLPSGTVMYFSMREEPFEHKSICMSKVEFTQRYTRHNNQRPKFYHPYFH